MPDAPSVPAAPPPLPPVAPAPDAIAISRRELLWLTFGVCLGGVFILAVLPMLFIPRFGLPLGVAASYFVFFLAWQPVQSITQRALGMRSAVVRMVIFVGAAATCGYYVREILLEFVRTLAGSR